MRERARGGQVHRTVGQRERVLVPVHARHRGSRQTVVLGPEHRVPPTRCGQLDPPRPDFLDWARGHCTTQCRCQLLCPQAHTQDGHPLVDGGGDERSLRCEPREHLIVMDTHWAAHDNEAADVGHIGDRVAQVEADHVDGDTGLGQ